MMKLYLFAALALPLTGQTQCPMDGAGVADISDGRLVSALAALPDGCVLLAWEEGEPIRSEIVSVTGTS